MMYEYDVIGINSVPVSAEGRVEHQTLNQVAALLSFGFVFGVQLGSLEKKYGVDRSVP